MKIAVIGSRSITDPRPVTDKLKGLKVTGIISGGANGVDTTAERWADLTNTPKLIIRPNYQKYGKAAPLKRNEKIVEAADHVLAIWDGKSTGTLHAISYAKKLGKPVTLVNTAQKDQMSLF